MKLPKRIEQSEFAPLEHDVFLAVDEVLFDGHLEKRSNLVAALDEATDVYTVAREDYNTHPEVRAWQETRKRLSQGGDHDALRAFLADPAWETRRQELAEAHETAEAAMRAAEIKLGDLDDLREVTLIRTFWQVGMRFGARFMAQHIGALMADNKATETLALMGYLGDDLRLDDLLKRLIDHQGEQEMIPVHSTVYR